MLLLLLLAWVPPAVPWWRAPALLQRPAPCTTGTHILVLVHSAPGHAALRQALRQTWARERPGLRAVFLVGVPAAGLEVALGQEGEAHGDLLQADFADSYRNLTMKHLTGYTWARDHCAAAAWILKADDDLFVDTLHLPRLLAELGASPAHRLFLCQLLRRGPERDPANKWFVTEAEYPGSSYPPYCAGWAYVTTQPAIAALLEAAPRLPPLWIDDLYVTGLLPATLSSPITYYDWSYSFLNHHMQQQAAVQQGDFYTPELMVVGDVEEQVMRHVWAKAERCAARGCLQLLYGDPEARGAFLPRLVEGGRQEL
jgi:hypothetical protein